MTTKIDRLRDILIDAFINLDFKADMSDDGDGEVETIPEWLRNEIIGDMLTFVEDYDEPATKQDMTVRVVMDKTADTPFGDRLPEENKGSVIL